jgi:hypothetical protein
MSPARILSRTLLGFALTVLACVSVGSTTAAAADRVVLISWDGIRADVLRELLEWQPLGETPEACPAVRHTVKMPIECNGYLTCLPALCNFQIINSAVVEGKPLTRPQHAQMLSGYGPAETGEITNAGKLSLPPGFTIYERIHASRPELFNVHIAGRKFVGQGIIRWAVDAGAVDLDLRRGGRDNYTGIATTARVVTALDTVGDTPFFMFVHYKAADVIGHRAGDRGRPYREAIIQNDIQLEAVLNLLAARELLPTTEVFVTTDHGFHGIFHLKQDDPAIMETWFASLRHNLDTSIGSVLDVTPTILTTLDISVSSAVPPYRGRALVPRQPPAEPEPDPAPEPEPTTE